MTTINSRNMESLPNQFVSAMKTLFDIMDDKHTGLVKLTDIENRWRDDRTKGLPRGVIESLQKVASHDGLLSFERFCTGLKICLLRNQVECAAKKVESVDNNVKNTGIHSQVQVTQVHRPPSAPLLDVNEAQNIERKWNALKSSDNSTHRTISMPQLIGRKEPQVQEITTLPSLPKHDSPRIYGPPKPPRLEKNSQDRKESRSIYKSEEDTTFAHDDIAEGKLDFEEISRAVEEQSRGLADGRSSNDTQSQMRRASRRREPRRHTLHNGVDYNLLKRMKQIEQEKDVLLQGLAAVEEAREWYLKQLTEVQEKMRYAGRMGTYVEPWSEAHQERLELLRARVLELNRQLGALAAGWRHGQLSLHMNLALPVASLSGTPPVPNAAVLKSQNRMLAEEVNRKNERISVLEREKSALIRELLLQRNRTKLMDNFT
ncbi:suppressor APC domain-containing protein 2 [Plodia interpunctella]|uniref:suppressor APC domain-containing protein 2 n=1 Tax=Plodia interpunctella TaxID=58824 RepID=UPI0023675AD5|nr:suppressor APC domain-containing protein 2 [Plodia interpunctella]